METEQKFRVVLVEDHPMFREQLRQLIDREPGMMVCGEADNIHDGLSLAESTHPDIAIVDLTLKGPSGLELIKNLKAKEIDVPLLVLSMHDEALYAERALHAGARGYVMKRETTKNVLTAIRRVLGGDIYVSDRVVNTMAKRMSSRKTAAAEPVERLSDRELEIFRLLGQGRTPSQIAEDLRLSLKTVQAYCARAKEKFGVTSLTELLRAAIRWEDAMQPK